MVNMYKNGSIWSGFRIGLAGWIFLSTGGGILGAILFAIGLQAVVYFGSSLYTGKAGSWEFRVYCLGSDIWGLSKVLIGNIIGCLVIGLLARFSDTINPETMTGIISSRSESSSLEVLAKGIGCGFLMELAVWTWREKKSILGVLFCVPAFILSGFYHSVADAFYYIAYGKLEWWIGWVYLLTVLGNFIGCSLRRLVMPYK